MILSRSLEMKKIGSPSEDPEKWSLGANGFHSRHRVRVHYTLGSVSITRAALILLLSEL